MAANPASQTCWRCLARLRPNVSRYTQSHRAYLSTSRTLQQTESQSSTPPSSLPEPVPSSLIQPRSKQKAEDVEGIGFDHEEYEGDIKHYIREELFQLAKKRNVTPPASLTTPPINSPGAARLPKPIQSLYLQPLKRQPTHNIPSAYLQLRSYSARNLELMADFALRAAYYLNLPAKGPVPLPRITERWTVPRSVFVHKKSQENWERITMRRLIQVVDGDPEVVQRWLAFVRKWTWYSVGFKAQVFQHEPLPEQLSAKERDEKKVEEASRAMSGVDWSLFGRREGLEGEKEVATALEKEGFAKGTIAEAVKAVGGEGGGGYSARLLREGKKVRRTAESKQEAIEWKRRVMDEMKVFREGYAREMQRGETRV